MIQETASLRIRIAKWLSPFIYGASLVILVFIDTKIVLGLLSEILDIRAFTRFSGEFGAIFNIGSPFARFFLLEVSFGTILLLIFNGIISKFESLKGNDVTLKDHFRQSFLYYSVLVFVGGYSFFGLLMNFPSRKVLYYAGIYYLPLVVASIWAIMVNAAFLWFRKTY